MNWRFVITELLGFCAEGYFPESIDSIGRVELTDRGFLIWFNTYYLIGLEERNGCIVLITGVKNFPIDDPDIRRIFESCVDQLLGE